MAGNPAKKNPKFRALLSSEYVFCAASKPCSKILIAGAAGSFVCSQDKPPRTRTTSLLLVFVEIGLEPLGPTEFWKMSPY